MLGGVIGSSVSRGIARPDALRAAAYASYPVVLGRDDHVVAVVAARQEHADQRPVVGSLGERVDQAEPLDAGDERGGAERVSDARLAASAAGTRGV